MNEWLHILGALMSCPPERKMDFQPSSNNRVRMTHTSSREMPHGHFPGWDWQGIGISMDPLPSLGSCIPQSPEASCRKSYHLPLQEQGGSFPTVTLLGAAARSSQIAFSQDQSCLNVELIASLSASAGLVAGSENLFSLTKLITVGS